MRVDVAVAALLLATSLAGCGGDSLTTQSDATVAAGTLLQKATAVGQAWHADAMLTALGAVEISTHSNNTAEVQKQRSKSPEFAALVPGGDTTVGDGKSQAWEFAFYAPAEKEAMQVIMSPAGEVTYRKEWRGSQANPYASVHDVSNFTVDSDQAAGLATLKEPKYQDLQPTAETASAGLQFGNGNRTEWVLSVNAIREGITTSVIVRVDAHNGNVRLEGSAGKVGNKTAPPKPPQEAGQVSGNLPQGGSSSQTFVLKKAHDKLNLRLDLPNPQPASSVRVTVTTPAGDAVTLTANYLIPVITSPSDTSQISGAPLGTYKVDATLSQGIGQDFTVSYCSTEVGAADNPACPASQ